MKHKLRLATQMFLVIAGVLAMALAIHAMVLKLSFPRLYEIVQERQMEEEFSSICTGVDFSGRTGISTALLDYANKYETAVLVFDDTGEIWDGNLFFSLSMLSVRTADGQIFRMPIRYVKDLPDSLAGNTVEIRAQRLGKSSYFDPETIMVNGNCYYIKNTKYSYGEEDINYQTILKQARFTQVEGSKSSDRAWILYEYARDILIDPDADMESELATLSNLGSLSDGSQNCCFLCYSRKSGDRTVFYVTLVPVGMSGVAAVFIEKYFESLYAILVVMLVGAAFLLSRRLSRPMVELGEQAKRIAKRDFSAVADSGHTYELNMLAENLNSMSCSLKTAMDELMDSAKQAAENEDRIRQLMANLAHEFKTPLGIISLYTEVIEAENFEKDRSFYFNIINEEIDSLTRMVDEAIQLCKLQSGQMKLDPRKVDLQSLVDAAFVPFELTIANGNFQICTDIPDVEVWADGVRIRQVLVNLISNALKYSVPEGQIGIYASLENDSVRISVENSGYVSPENLERIWNRYYREPNTAVTRLPGDGIGLDIAREILVLSDSSYGVEQKDGVISFTFTLPLAENSEEEIGQVII